MKKILVRLLCCFVPYRQNRKKIRQYFLGKKTDDITNYITYNKNIATFQKGLTGKNDSVIVLKNNSYLKFRNVIVEGINIGRHTYIGDYTKLDSLVSVGHFCSIANNVLIGATMHPTDWLSTSPFQYDNWLKFGDGKSKYNYELRKKTHIGNDVWIGAHAVIKTGLTIGDGAIIGAGAIITHDVPPYAIMGGVPARVIRYRFPQETIEDLLKLKWWDLPDEKIKTLPFNDIEACIKKLKKLH